MHLTRGTDELHFYYDAQNKPAEVIFNGVAYGYLYNLQGDVVALVDGTGTKVVEYSYDAWGKTTGKTGSLAGTLGTLQPFRYRGYVWDEETGDYYLRSRYYRAEWGRFISADILLSDNLFCYCENAPISREDRDGCLNDYTGIFLEALHRDLYLFIEHQVDDICSVSAGTILSNLDRNIRNYRWFAMQVDDEARWDVNNPASWKKIFPRYKRPTSDNKVLFRGELVSSEDFGNIAYGYLGTAMGLSPKTLFIFGGFAKKKNGRSLSSMTLTDIANVLYEVNEEGEEGNWGDDKNDHFSIQFGIDLFKNDSSILRSILLIFIVGAISFVMSACTATDYRETKFSVYRATERFMQHFDEFDETAHLICSRPDFIKEQIYAVGQKALDVYVSASEPLNHINQVKHDEYFTDDQWNLIYNTFHLFGYNMSTQLFTVPCPYITISIGCDLDKAHITFLFISEEDPEMHADIIRYQICQSEIDNNHLHLVDKPFIRLGNTGWYIEVSDYGDHGVTVHNSLLYILGNINATIEVP